MVLSLDPNELERRRGMLPSDVVGFDPEELIRQGAFCLIEGQDLALFEEVSPRIYSGHYFFESRGKEALGAAVGFLGYVFNRLDALVVQGVTPINNKAALWFTRKLGFRMLDCVDTGLGPMQISMMSQKDYNELYLRRQ